MSKTIISLECPTCKSPARAEIDKFYKFVIYLCPKCHSNVVFFNNKIGVISDRMVHKLLKKKKLRICGNALFHIGASETKKIKHPPLRGDSEVITEDKITDLKILLETERDIDNLLTKL